MMWDSIVNYFKHVDFQNPEWFWAMLLLPILAFYYYKRNKDKSIEFNYSDLSRIEVPGSSAKARLIHFPFVLRCAAIAVMVTALARPQSTLSWQDVTTEGIDIVISQDVSLSMLAQDLKPNRIEASKNIAADFSDQRPNDRVGLVVFAGEGFTQCPLTTDHSVLKNQISEVKCGKLADGTAIGMGLATAVNRIKDSKAKSKVIILLTDGENNAGNVAPETAAEIAKAFGIRVYTIAVGTRGMAYSPIGVYPNGQYVFDYIPVNIDEVLLKKMAQITGGKYFRATSNQALKNIYSEIDKLEKSKIEVTEFRKRKEEFRILLLIAATLLLGEFLIKHLYLRSSLVY